LLCLPIREAKYFSQQGWTGEQISSVGRVSDSVTRRYTVKMAEPSSRAEVSAFRKAADSSRECAPDDRLRDMPV
jgi:hypothetical protein